MTLKSNWITGDQFSATAQNDVATAVNSHDVLATAILSAATAYVATAETTASTTFTDLATTSDSVTATITSSGKAIVFISHCMASATVDGTANIMGFALSGANTVAASDAYAIGGNNRDSGGPKGGAFLLTGLTSGSTTFKAKYRVTGGTMGFSYRRISVIPL